jgi:hypothetical protein
MTTRPLLPLAPPDGCATCRTGCTCLPDRLGCGHYGCRGRGPVLCPIAEAARAAYEERLAATRRQRAVLASRRAAWRNGALLAHMLP